MTAPDMTSKDGAAGVIADLVRTAMTPAAQIGRAHV